MKILQIGPIPPEIGGQTTGGVATHMWSLATHLVERGHRVAVLADNYGLTNEWPEVRDSVEIFGMDRPIYADRTGLVLKPSFWSKVFRTKSHFGSLKSWPAIIGGLLCYHQVIEFFQPDVIHVHHLERRFPLAYFTAECKIPIITTVHSTHFIEFSHPPVKDLRRRFVQRNLDLAYNLIFVSQFLKKRYEELFPGGLEGRQTYIIHNPIDSSLYYPIPKEEARRRLGKLSTEALILFVGNLIPRKGAHLLIEAAANLKSKGVQFSLLIVGDGPQKAEMERTIRQNELGSVISLEGGKTQADLLYYYNAADIFVLPSLSESFGLVYIEAMLCGCPVIGTPKVLDEILPSDDCGHHIPHGDTRTLAITIENAMQQPWDRERIRSHALTFAWDHLIGNFENVYKDIAK